MAICVISLGASITEEILKNYGERYGSSLVSRRILEIFRNSKIPYISKVSKTTGGDFAATRPISTHLKNI